MKKILFLFAFALALASCKKSSFVSKFDEDPDVRMNEAIAKVKTILSSSDNGWVATMPTLDGGGYSFFMRFDGRDSIKMIGDLNDASSSKVAVSSYRIKQDAGVDLVFDTYNYITLLNDPDPSAFGGNLKTGFKSDIDFIYDRSTADSIVFIGKRYRQTLKMVKATADQKAKYEAGALKTAIDKIKAYFVANPNSYIEVVSGGTTIKSAVNPNFSNSVVAGKRLDLSAVLADGSVVSSSVKFAYTLNGVDFLTNLIQSGIEFVNIKWKDTSTLAVYDSTGKEYIIKSSPTPLIPLFRLWGSKYAGMLSQYKTIYPGTSTAGAVILNYYHNGLVPPTQPYSFNYGRINFVWNVPNKSLKLSGFSSQNGGTSGWVTDIIYNYTLTDAGVYKFTLNTAASGGYVAVPLSKLDAFLLANTITFDYYVDNGNLYAKMTSVNDPTIVMTFALQ